MRTLADICKDVKTWYDETKPDLLSQEDFDQMMTFLEGQAHIEEELEECKRELEEDYYVDPSELGGFAGHYADENMYNKEEE